VNSELTKIGNGVEVRRKRRDKGGLLSSTGSQASGGLETPSPIKTEI